MLQNQPTSSSNRSVAVYARRHLYYNPAYLWCTELSVVGVFKSFRLICIELYCVLHVHMTQVSEGSGGSLTFS